MTAGRIAPLLVLAVGNPSRGDDAIGPALLDALHAQGVDAGGEVELLTDFQLQIEHALDLKGRHAVLFVDAARPGAVATAGGVALVPLSAAAALPALSHALTPAAVLHVAARLGGPVPPAWQLAVAGEAFGLGEAMSVEAQARLVTALAFAQGWIAARHGEVGAATGQEPIHA
jgi:hydrogenase maturation protease